MGYRCPVCDEPQLDGEHLANHLAFTAMIRSEDHEAWLDEHVTDWKERRPAELAETVTPHAPEEDLPDEVEAADTHDHVPGRERGRGAYSERQRELRDREREELTDEATEVMAEARAMTREMHERAEESGDDAERDDEPDGNA
ncbi:MAG: hypothetical protein ACI9YT_000661 [Halobacteriales archaeon]|jgi:hypothetical protein